MRTAASDYGEQRGDHSRLARQCARSVAHALRLALAMWGRFALKAAERHLHSLDDHTLRDLGLDPRDLPLRDQLARGSGRSTFMSHISAVLDYWH